MTTSAPRVAPGNVREAGLLVSGFARLAGRVTGTEPPAVFLTLGRHRRLFWGWLLFAGSLMPGGRLPRRETELVILRVATLSGNEYELTQHRRLGRRAGLSADEVDRVADGPEANEWGPRDRLLLRVTDELHARAGPLRRDLGRPPGAARRARVHRAGDAGRSLHDAGHHAHHAAGPAGPAPLVPPSLVE